MGRVVADVVHVLEKVVVEDVTGIADRGPASVPDHVILDDVGVRSLTEWV